MNPKPVEHKLYSSFQPGLIACKCGWNYQAEKIASDFDVIHAMPYEMAYQWGEHVKSFLLNIKETLTPIYKK